MSGEVFLLPDSPELRAWLASEEVSIENMRLLAESLRWFDPKTAMVLLNGARQREIELLPIRDALGLL